MNSIYFEKGIKIREDLEKRVKKRLEKSQADGLHKQQDQIYTNGTSVLIVCLFHGINKMVTRQGFEPWTP